VYDAALAGNAAKLQSLLAKPDVEIDRAQGLLNTPLMWASVGGSLDCVKLLTEKGADINKQIAAWVPVRKESIPAPAFHRMSVSGSEGEAEYTDKNGSGVRAYVVRTPGVGPCALSRAVVRERVEIVRYLLEKGATIPGRMCIDFEWTTMADLAKATGNAEIIALIERAGGSVPAKR
jgi:ankyrin repeat protein